MSKPQAPAPSNGTAQDNDNAAQFVESVSAAMPPGMRRNQQMSTDELLKEMNRVPLFMTSLDETDGEGGENTMLEAIKALAYEGTKAEVAENFRQQGNEAARAKLWTDAREFYTKAIQTIRGQLQTTDAEEDPSIKVTEEPDPEAEAEKENAILEACLTNRALCNLEMKNYGSCNRDCAAALQLNPRNTKAWYRAASACLALDRIPEALDACHSGLRFEASNAALKTLLQNTTRRQDHLATQQKSRSEREARQRAEHATLQAALRARNIPTRTTPSPPDLEDATLRLAAPLDATSTLSLPVLFLYPLHAQTDLLKSVAEHDAPAQHLDYMLPPPWDARGEYGTLDAVECYVETAAGGLIKAGKKVALAKLLGGGNVEVVDGLVRIFVLPKARAGEWIEQFKLRRGKV